MNKLRIKFVPLISKLSGPLDLVAAAENYLILLLPSLRSLLTVERISKRAN